MKTTSFEETQSKERISLARALVFRFFNRLKNGRLVLTESNKQFYFGDPTSELIAHINIRHTKAYSRLSWGGDIGAAEAYVEGLWQSDDLVNVIRLFSRNLTGMAVFDKNLGALFNLLNKLRHRLNQNSKSGSRVNIAAHYDLSNEMYRLFLDEDMQYSSAIYSNQNLSLAEAQENKMKTLCDHLELSENDHLLEIGSGWGGLACYAAEKYGCSVTTTTISQAQFDLAKERIHSLGLQNKITLLKKDYRDLEGQYSKVVSVEMLEAVGHKFFPLYFKTLENLLKPGGKALIQTITINDQRYESYRDSVDFIRRYIFPGGHLPCISVLSETIKQHTNLAINYFSDYRQDYAETLKEWQTRFISNRPAIEKLGFNDDFIRLWQYYFSYCEGGFRESIIGLAHIELIKHARP